MDTDGLGIVLRGYRLVEGHLAFSNQWTTHHSMSHGRVWNLEVDEIPHDPDKPFFRYRITWFWTYRNSYDLKEGLAHVHLFLDDPQRGSDFLLDIKPLGEPSILFSGLIAECHLDPAAWLARGEED
jgi:hypothetical protein